MGVLDMLMFKCWQDTESQCSFKIHSPLTEASRNQVHLSVMAGKGQKTLHHSEWIMGVCSERIGRFLGLD
jgi:hypothetical protein